MKKIVIAFLLFFNTSALLLAQKTINDLHVQKREVSGFTSIHVATGIELILTEGVAEEVAVSASTPEFRDKIVTEVKNGVLHLYYDNKVKSVNTKKARHDLKAYVSYKTLEGLDVTTGAQVTVEGTLKAGKLKISANTGGIINGKLDVAELQIEQNTGSKVTFTGNAVSLKAEGSTGSKFWGDELTTDICKADVSTGAIILATANKELNAKASTGGAIRYKGTATIKDIKRSTGGAVNKI